MGVVDCASRYNGFISGSGTEERRAAEVLGATRGTRRQRSRAGNIFLQCVVSSPCLPFWRCYWSSLFDLLNIVEFSSLFLETRKNAVCRVWNTKSAIGVSHWLYLEVDRDLLLLLFFFLSPLSLSLLKPVNLSQQQQQEHNSFSGVCP